MHFSCCGMIYPATACFFFSSKTVTAEQKRSFLSPDAQHSVTCLLLHSPDSWQDNTLFQKVSSHTHSSPFSVTKPQTTTTVATVVARLLPQSLPLYICCCHYNRWNIFPWASSWYASSSVSLWLARQVNLRIALGDSEFPMSGVMRCPIYTLHVRNADTRNWVLLNANQR